jgi:hypothetical protein
MEPQIDFSSFQQKTQPVPNATAVLVLGIISIVTCCCYGLPGIICGVIALVLAVKGQRAYVNAPHQYTDASWKNLKAGRICAIIGLILSILTVIYMIVVINEIGIETLKDPKALQRYLEELQEANR